MSILTRSTSNYVDWNTFSNYQHCWGCWVYSWDLLVFKAECIPQGSLCILSTLHILLLLYLFSAYLCISNFAHIHTNVYAYIYTSLWSRSDFCIYRPHLVLSITQLWEIGLTYRSSFHLGFLWFLHFHMYITILSLLCNEITSNRERNLPMLKDPCE